MAGIDKTRENGSYNKFDGKRSERGAFGTVHGKFIIFHNNSLPKNFPQNLSRILSVKIRELKIITCVSELFSQKFVNKQNKKG